MTTPSLDDTDEAVVRWHECTRRQAYATDIQAVLNIRVDGHVSYVCPWSPDHFHVGRIPHRRGSGRRIAQARYHLAKHLDATKGPNAC